MNVCFWDKYRSRHEELQRSLVTTSGRSFPTTISGRRKSEDDHLTGAAMVGDSVVRETEQPPHQHQVW